MRPRHLALPARLCAGSAASRKLSELGVRGVFASLFDQRPSPTKATRGRPHTAGRLWALQKSRHCGTKHNAQEFAQARHGEFVLWRTAKTFIDSSTDITNSASVIPSKVACQAGALRDGLEESPDIFPILPLGHSRTITAAWPLLFRGLRSPSSACLINSF